MRLTSRLLTFTLLLAPVGASLVDVVKRKRTNKAKELFTVDADGTNIGAAEVNNNNNGEEAIDDRALDELWNEATELEFIDERMLQSMSVPQRGNFPSEDGLDESPDEAFPPSGDPPSIDEPTPPEPTPPEPTPSEPTNPPEPSEPTTPPEPTEPTTPPAPTNPGECLEGTTRRDYLLNLLSEVTDVELLEDPNTPQGEAFQFMVDDTFDPCTYPTIEQRYGLSVLYYATEGDDWDENEGWVQDGVPECEWFNVTCEEVLSEVVVAVQLSTLNCETVGLVC